MSAAPIDPRILDEAAEWLLQLSADSISDVERATFERWRRRSSEHARAWARAESLLIKLGSVPAPLALSVGVAIADAAYRNAAMYARGRRSGRAPSGALNPPLLTMF
jgi:transmembrane sensor